MKADDATSTRTSGPSPGTKRRRWRRSLVGVAALAAAGWLGMAALRLQGSPDPDVKPPSLPNPNGYDDLLEASRALKDVMPVVKGQLPDYARFETPALRDFVAMIRRPLGQIREGLGRPFQVPYAYDLNGFMQTTMRDVGQVRVYANRALQAEGLLARREMRTADEARSALDLVRLGNSLGREAPMAVYLASLPSVYLGSQALRDMRDRLVDDPELCRKTIAELARLDRDRPPVDRAAERELAFMRINVRSHGMVAATVIRATGALTKQTNQAVASLRQSGQRSEAIRRLVLADLAVRLYQKEHDGAPPDSLEALVPAILPRVPIDPFTDRPLVYRVVEHGFQLYSAGPDRDDDRLSPVLKQLGRNDSNGDATVESF